MFIALLKLLMVNFKVVQAPHEETTATRRTLYRSLDGRTALTTKLKSTTVVTRPHSQEESNHTCLHVSTWLLD